MMKANTILVVCFLFNRIINCHRLILFPDLSATGAVIFNLDRVS